MTFCHKLTMIYVLCPVWGGGCLFKHFKNTVVFQRQGSARGKCENAALAEVFRLRAVVDSQGWLRGRGADSSAKRASGGVVVQQYSGHPLGRTLQRLVYQVLYIRRARKVVLHNRTFYHSV